MSHPFLGQFSQSSPNQIDHNECKLRLDYRNLEEQLSNGKIANVSLPEIKTAIEQLSFEERAELAAWLHGWNDDEWDEQMKRDIGSGKLDDVLHEVEEDIKSGRTREMP